MAPTHVVVDQRDGYVFWRSADRQLFTHMTAQQFASSRNAELKNPPQHFTTYKVFQLVSA